MRPPHTLSHTRTHTQQWHIKSPAKHLVNVRRFSAPSGYQVFFFVGFVNILIRIFNTANDNNNYEKTNIKVNNSLPRSQRKLLTRQTSAESSFSDRIVIIFKNLFNNNHIFVYFQYFNELLTAIWKLKFSAVRRQRETDRHTERERERPFENPLGLYWFPPPDSLISRLGVSTRLDFKIESGDTFYPVSNELRVELRVCVLSIIRSTHGSITQRNDQNKKEIQVYLAKGQALRLFLCELA